MRKHRLILCTIFCVLTLMLSTHAEESSSASPSTTKPGLAHVKIEIVDLRNTKGQLVFGVFKSADGFPTVEKKSVYWQVLKKFDSKKVTFEVDLPPGRYTGSVLHDENGDGVINYNLIGVPVEGYGVTNNPKPALRQATFDEAVFTVPPEGITKQISLQYFR